MSEKIYFITLWLDSGKEHLGPYSIERARQIISELKSEGHVFEILKEVEKKPNGGGYLEEVPYL